MESLTWGIIPKDLEIKVPYEMILNKEDLKIVVRIVNQGIDSHLEAVHVVQSLNNMSQISIVDSASIRTFLRRLVEDGNKNGNEDEDEDQEKNRAGWLAACIMETLGYEWI